MKIKDKTKKPSKPSEPDWRAPESRSRREERLEGARQRGFEARERGLPRRRYYSGMLRDLTDDEVDRLSEFMDRERRQLTALREHPAMEVRSRGGRMTRELEELRQQIAPTLHPSEKGIRELMETRGSTVRDMARARGISEREAAIAQLRKHGAANKLAMERLGMESQTPLNKLQNAARGFMRYDLPRKAMAARRFLKNAYQAISTPDPFDPIGPVMMEMTRGSYPAPPGVQAARTKREA
jgi:hypothetical protein